MSTRGSTALNGTPVLLHASSLLMGIGAVTLLIFFFFFVAQTRQYV
jgi:hypothetical protein